jgi:hypothetical protein
VVRVRVLLVRLVRRTDVGETGWYARKKSWKVVVTLCGAKAQEAYLKRFSVWRQLIAETSLNCGPTSAFMMRASGHKIRTDDCRLREDFCGTWGLAVSYRCRRSGERTLPLSWQETLEYSRLPNCSAHNARSEQGAMTTLSLSVTTTRLTPRS